MGYLGNEPTTGHFPVQTNLVGPGPTYTLDRAPASAGAIEVSVAGVLQPTTSYSVSGTTLTMAGVASSIPIFIRYLGETLILPTIADGVVVEAKLGAGAVTTAKLANTAVTLAKMAANSVDSDAYVDGSIDAVHLSANSVDSDAYVDASIDNAHLADDAVGVAELSATGTASSSTFLRGDNAWAAAGGGKILQVVNVMSNDVATGTTVMPFDNTIPTNAEGDEYMTLAITAANGNNKLLIQVCVNISLSIAASMAVALFKDSAANAVAAVTQFESTATGNNLISFNHFMAAGTTAATTFKVRAGGGGASTATFNGQNAGRLFGGVIASSITITEIEV